MSRFEKFEVYLCEMCGETFEKGWSDAEAEAELARRFPDVPTAECALICDDCEKVLLARMRAAGIDIE